jgi:hypothetical protein
MALLAGAMGWGAGLAGATRAQTPPQVGVAGEGAPASVHGESELAPLREEVARLRRLVPSQSHAMQDVSYHYTNLWFAGQNANWGLAQFYLNETRSHIGWAVRLIPRRKVSTGELDLEGIREAFDAGYLTRVQQAIDAKDAARFAEAYKSSLEGCYACHKASEKPFLRLQVPTQPDTHIVNFDPNATWP